MMRQGKEAPNLVAVNLLERMSLKLEWAIVWDLEGRVSWNDQWS